MIRWLAPFSKMRLIADALDDVPLFYKMGTSVDLMEQDMSTIRF